MRFVHSLGQPHVASLPRHIVSVSAASYSSQPWEAQKGISRSAVTRICLPFLFLTELLMTLGTRMSGFIEMELFWIEIVEIMLLSTK